MRLSVPLPAGPSRAERISDGVVHVVGLALALVSVPLLIAMTAIHRAEPAALLAASVYGATLILMLSCSALYNMTDSLRWRGLLRRLDHSAIYVKIAGTYTPFTLLSGVPATGLLAGLWGSALAGALLKMIAPGRFRWLALALYLGMGWAALFAGGAMLEALPARVTALMVAGGIVYTAGVAFYLLERLAFHTAIWHLFVLAGSALFFAAVAHVLAGLPGPA
ncbi:PAQR family membrane homeostasis protein TrhA [Mangrovicoccus algicola]|uniref:Hemolysin III family protein n=1 Tax=Mangrovicoccus algicola TaxID=2771008 RepID=A0A8J7CYR1_9RHOB|nr:hemolysin III family protein [Mangrovicoccus algicola]MBE3639882.1 hemolysin III family protein [Mangrovicoccus algicola]